MKRNLPISQKKKFKYSITFQSFDEESLEAGDSFDRGYEVEDTIDLIGDILYKAYSTYGIYMPVAFGTWESTNPLENTDFYEKGIQKYFAIHITNEDGTQISQEENDFITFILSDGNYELNKFREYAVGGIVLGSIALGIGALITYFYFKGKKGNKSGSTNNRAKSITHTINGKDRKFPIKDAWKKEHTLENQSEEYEVPQEERFEMGGYASEHYHEIEYGEGGVARAKEVIMNKIGFNEENANYLVSQSEKFSIWLADSILKQEIRRLNDLEKSVNRTNIIDKKSTLDFINKRNNHIQYGYSTPIREILDWLQHPITPKQDLKQLSFDQALIKAREWHNELQVLGGDIDFTEPETNTILKKYPVNSDGIEYYWVYIDSNYCDLESSRMGHCGRTGYGNKLISLRSVKPYGKGHTISDSHVTIAYGSDGTFYQVKGKKNNKPSEKYFPYIFDLIKSIISENGVEYSKESMNFDKTNKLYNEIRVLGFNGFGSEYGAEEDYGFEDMTEKQIREIFDLKPTLFESAEDNYMLLDAGIITLDELKEIVEREPETFSSFVNQMNLYEKGIITEQPSTTFEFKADCDEVRALLDISRDFNDDLVAEILCGDIGELSDGWSYYYDNPSDLVNNLNKENEQKVIDEIVRITKLDESVVKKNGIEYYLNGDDENFSPNDDFDNIIRALASAQNQADNNDYYKYLYNAIESALNELGEVHSLNDEGVKMTIDLSNSMSLEEIAEKMDYYEFTDVEDLFKEKIGEEIDRPSLRIDDRYSPYGSSEDFNEYISDIDLERGYKKGGVLRTKNISTNKKIKNMKSIQNKFADGGRLTHFNRHISMDSETMSEILKMTNYPLLKEYFVEKNGEIKYDRIKSELKREGVSTEMINNYLSGLFDGYNYSNTDAFKKEMAKLKLVDKEFYDKVMTLYEKISKYPKINVEYADKKAHFTWIMNNYGFVIPNREDVNYTMSDFAKDIKKTYSLDNPRNKEAYDYVNKFGDIRLFNSADMDKFERKMLEIEVEFADGGRVTTNDGIIEAFITTNKQLNVGNISTHFNEYDNQMLLRNYGTLIATRKGNDVSITNIKYSKTTTTITNKIRNIALEKRMNISYVDKFADGGETQKVNLGNGEMDLDEAIKIYEEKIKAQGRVVNARDEDVLEQLKRMKNKFAEGGLTEHGLMAGDTIRNDYSVVYPNKKSLKDIIDVTDKDGEIQFVNLDKGIRYDDGGETTEFNYLYIKEVPNGLKLELTDEGINGYKEEEINDMYDLFEDIQANSEMAYIDNAGDMGFGLTEAPIITDGYYYDDMGEFTDEGVEDSKVYVWNDYMLKDLFATLMEQGSVVLTEVKSYNYGGETFTEKYIESQGGVDYYSVDYDDVNAQEFRDDIFDTLEEAKLKFDELCENGKTFEDVPLDNVQLLEVYKSGEYQTLNSKMFYDFAKGGSTDDDRPQYKKAKSWKDIENHPLVDDTSIEENDPSEGKDYWVYLKNGYCWESPNSEQHIIHEWGVKDTIREFNNSIYRCNCSQCVNEGKYKDGGRVKNIWVYSKPMDKKIRFSAENMSNDSWIDTKSVVNMSKKEIEVFKKQYNKYGKVYIYDEKGKYAGGGEAGGVEQNFEVGDIVELSESGWDNESYHDFFKGVDNIKLVITDVYTNESEHQGFDTGVGMALYSTKTLENDEEVPFDLYDYELEYGGLDLDGAKIIVKEIDADGNFSVEYDEENDEWYWEENYSNGYNNYRGGFSSELQAYNNLIDYLQENNYAEGGKTNSSQKSFLSEKQLKKYNHEKVGHIDFYSKKVSGSRYSGITKEVYFKDGFRPSFAVVFEQEPKEVYEKLKKWVKAQKKNFNDIIAVKYSDGGKAYAEGGEAGDKTNEYWERRENLEMFLNLNDEDIYWKWVNGELTDLMAVELIKEIHGVDFDATKKYAKGGETYSLSQFPIYAEYSGEVRYIRNPKRDKGRGKNKEFAVNLMRNGKIEDYEYFHFDTEKNANKWVNKLNKFQEENMTPENKKLVYDWFAENDDRISELIGNDLRELNLQDFRWYVKKQQKNNFAKGGGISDILYTDSFELDKEKLAKAKYHIAYNRGIYTVIDNKTNKPITSFPTQASAVNYIKTNFGSVMENGGELAKPISFTEEKKGLYYVQFSDDSNVLVDFTTPYFADQRTKKYIFQQAIHNYKRELEEERPYQVYNYDTQNVEGYFDNEIEAEEFASKFKNATIYDIRQYAGGGSVKKDKLQQARDYWKELEGQMSAKQKKFYNELLKRRQPSFEKNFNDSEIAEYINGEIIEQFGVDLGITKYQITGVNWFKLGFKYIAYREAIEEPEFWEEMNEYAEGGEADILKLYQKDTFSDKNSDLINDAIENGDIYTDEIKEDFLGYIQDQKHDFTDEQIWSYTDENYSNGQTHKENYKNLVEYIKENEYAFGGEVEDWMEQALDSLIKETGNEDLDITMVSDNGNEFFAGNDMEEYRVFKTEKDAEEKAIEQVREDLEENPDYFYQDWLMNYIDGRDFFEEALNEMNESYVQDIESEDDSKYANRLIAELVENGLLDEEDALSENNDELIDESKYDYINLLTDQQTGEGNNGLDYFINNFGEKETYRMVMDNNLIDIDEASRDAVQSDGIAHFIASYDRITLYLLNNNVAYRNN